MSTAHDLPAVLPDVPALRLAPEPASGVDFDAFVRRYETRLLRLVQRRLNDRSDAEEITQETLLRAYQHRASFSAEDELIAWSTVVAQRLVIDRARVRGRSIAVADVPETARLGRDTADIVVAKAEARTALDALESIPDRQAAILWAREVEGLHYEEIADRFGITEPAVRSLLHRGRRALRKEYTARGGTLPMRGLVPLAPWLLALKSLGKVRSAAKGAAKAAAPAVTALTLAGLTILGSGGGGLAPEGAPREVGLPASDTQRTSFESTLPRDSEVGPGARSLTLTRTRTADRGTRPGWHVDVPQTCAGGFVTGDPACIGEVEEFNGDTLAIGPSLPENPTGYDRVVVSVEAVPLCTVVPATPVTECTAGTTRDPISTTARRTTPGSNPAEGALR